MIPPMGKKRRPNKRKSDLEEMYPDYLMKAFFSEKLLASASNEPGTANAANGAGSIAGKKRRRKPSTTSSAPGPPVPSRSLSITEQYPLGETGGFRKMVSHW